MIEDVIWFDEIHHPIEVKEVKEVMEMELPIRALPSDRGADF